MDTVIARFPRLFAVGLLALCMQATLGRHGRLFGAHFDFVLVFVVSVSLSFGATYGTVTGLIAGFFSDALSGMGFGYASSVYILWGYIAGTFHRQRGMSWSLSALLGCVFCAASTAMLAVLGAVTGVFDIRVETTLWLAVVAGVCNGAMVPLVMKLLYGSYQKAQNAW